MDRRRQTTFLYVATHNPVYVEMARDSIESLRDFWNGDVRILTDLKAPWAGELGVRVVRVPRRSRGQESRFYKTTLRSYTDRTYNVFLDCDTEILGSLDGLLERAWTSQLALATCVYPISPPLPYINEESEYTTRFLLERGIEFFPHYNAGVMAFRRDTEAFFRTWHDEWLVFRWQDQPALIRALVKCQLVPTRLPQTYNQWKDQPCKIRHFLDKR